MSFLAWIGALAGAAWTAIWPQWALAGLAFALLFVFRSYFAPRRIQQRWPDRRQLLHELIASALTLSIGSLIGVAIAALASRGFLTVPSGPVSPWRVAGEVLLYVVLFDVYFYFAHRLFHTNLLYWMHRHHHRSEAPDPLTAFSFHPLEGLLTGGFAIVMSWAFGLHVYSLIAANAYGIVNGVLIHSGHEVFPRWWFEHRVTRFVISPMFHDRHHATFHYNFGAYTTLWDRLFGTMQPSFEADYQAFHERLAARRRT